MKKRKLNGRFCGRRYYNLPEKKLKVPLLYYYAGVGVISSCWLISVAFGMAYEESKQIIKNKMESYEKSRTIIIVREVGRRDTDRDDIVDGEIESSVGGVQEVDESQASQDEQAEGSISLIDRIRATFPEEPEVAVAIAKAESGLNPSASSWTDFTSDGKPFSYGLFQLNLSVHNLDNVACHTAFEGRNYKSKVVNEQLYNECVSLASDVEVNLRKARQIYDSRGWLAWGAYTNRAFLKHLGEF